VLKVAILGFGFIGKAHGEAYSQLPNVELIAIGGCSKQRVQEWKAPYPVQYYPDADTLLQSSGADIVDICLPTFLHEEFVTKAAERGMHVICEKPLALTVAEVDRMLAAVKKAGVTFMVAQVLRFFPYYAKCRELVQQGRLGNVVFTSASRLSQFPPWGDWFRDPEKSGGALFDLQVHDLDFLLNLFGMPDRVFASGLQSASGSWDHVVNMLSYPGLRVGIEASYLLPPSRPFTSALRLVGTAGSVEYEFRVTGNVDANDGAQHSLTLYPNDGLAMTVGVEAADPYLRELKYFVDTVESGRKPDAVRPEEARNVIAMLEAARQSLESGTIIEFQSAQGRK
jgi:UDP-N-acetylglucosamine 3-dehydrogenase